jgi:hypothetical protein
MGQVVPAYATILAWTEPYTVSRAEFAQAALFKGNVHSAKLQRCHSTLTHNPDRDTCFGMMGMEVC